ncbi:short chain dehydrogenase [Nitzschia inconspicua]|uniref:Short chain dehydrogenase n=1 Tax=Nitzschia inconspicua TaxID=303405 RepID=A0A9K3Q813_9STRA|nr:short chain dehydrogenase [Nitzschia inconspicua]
MVGLLFSSLSDGNNCHYGSPIKSSSRQRQRQRQRQHSFYSTRSYHDNDDYDDTAPYSKTALVVGSSGSLGRTLTKYLSKDLQVKVIGADVVAPSSNDEQYLEGFVTMPLPTDESAPSSLPDLTMALVDGLSQLLPDDEKNATDLDAIISVAGGWEGDPELPPPNADDLDRLEGARQYGMTVERMMSKNLYPLLAAGYAAHHFMTDHDGLLVAIGATAALGGTPGMMGYGLSKVATHHFVQSLGELTTKSVTTKTKRQLARRLRKHVADDAKYLNTMSVIGILPTIIDTPMNREAMPDADFSQWTKSIDIAKEIGMWIEQPMLRPHSGSLVKVFPDNNNGKGGATFKLVR